MGLRVIDAGLSTTIQDLGRPGYRQWGVSPAGAFDHGSASLANALVGNSADCAVLEFTLQGGIYEAICPLAIALAGAAIEASLENPQSGDRQRLQLPIGCSMAQGQRLLLGRTSDGARAYMAVKGGWQTRSILGSRSSEERIASGTTLAAEPGTMVTRHVGEAVWTSPTAKPLRILPGPDCGEGADSGFDRSFWAGREFRVSARANRMGLRLEGEPAQVLSPAERLSMPVTPGAIQVAGGQLIILGIACGTMGGYPHVTQVISADIDRVGQLKPGDTVRFQQVTLSEARQLDCESRARTKLWRDRLRLLLAEEVLRTHGL
jgi:biotin-dependent carboxylase-like uncharacterized protein